MDYLREERVLFLYPYDYWPANPNCVSLVERCEKDGLSFDLVCPSSHNCRGKGREIPEWVWLARRPVYSALKQSLRRPWKIKALWGGLIHFYGLRRRFKNQNYSLVVTCDSLGLALLNRLNFNHGIPIIYLSYHILFRNELSTKNEKALADGEDHLVNDVRLALSQDENRKHLIAKELRLPDAIIHCIPVAPEERFPIAEKSSTQDGSKMILYCGNIENWNMEEVLDAVAANIPPNFHLRIHTHFKPHKRLHQKLLKLDEKNVLHFTFSFLSEEDLIHLIDSSYIGLAPYFPKPDSWMVNQTLHHIGKASTKIAYYCMRKKPVITTPLPSLLSSLSRYPFGRTISDWSKINLPLLEIDQNYCYFSSAAYAYYRSELCPTKGLNRFWEEITNLIPRSPS